MTVDGRECRAAASGHLLAGQFNREQHKPQRAWVQTTRRSHLRRCQGAQPVADRHCHGDGHHKQSASRGRTGQRSAGARRGRAAQELRHQRLADPRCRQGQAHRVNRDTSRSSAQSGQRRPAAPPHSLNAKRRPPGEGGAKDTGVGSPPIRRHGCHSAGSPAGNRASWCLSQCPRRTPGRGSSSSPS